MEEADLSLFSTICLVLTLVLIGALFVSMLSCILFWNDCSLCTLQLMPSQSSSMLIITHSIRLIPTSKYVLGDATNRASRVALSHRDTLARQTYLHPIISRVRKRYTPIYVLVVSLAYNINALRVQSRYVIYTTTPQFHGLLIVSPPTSFYPQFSSLRLPPFIMI